METLVQTVSEYVTELVVERWQELLVLIVMLALWRWFTFHGLRREIAELKRSGPPVSINLGEGASFHDFRGITGDIHINIEGQAEIITPSPATVHVTSVSGVGKAKFLKPGPTRLTRYTED